MKTKKRNPASEATVKRTIKFADLYYWTIEILPTRGNHEVFVKAHRKDNNELEAIVNLEDAWKKRKPLKGIKAAEKELKRVTR